MITYTNKRQAQHLFWINVRTYDFDIRFCPDNYLVLQLSNPMLVNFRKKWQNVHFVKSKCLFLTKFFPFFRVNKFLKIVPLDTCNSRRPVQQIQVGWVWFFWLSLEIKFTQSSMLQVYLGKYFNLFKFCWNYHSIWRPGHLFTFWRGGHLWE